MPMDSDGSDMLVRMYDDSNVYCATEIYDRVIANTTKGDVTALTSQIVLSRIHGDRDYVIDARLPELKQFRLPVQGHRGRNNRFQFIVMEPGNGWSYVVDARDLRVENPLTDLSDLSENALRLLLAIVREMIA